MRTPEDAANWAAYRSSEVVNHYVALKALSPCERHVFNSYVTPGMAVLDLGVGAGRTTPFLSRKASYYFGVDYSEAMIQQCRCKFPKIKFMTADASDLSPLASHSFDAVVMAFNALDFVLPDEKRLRCLNECRRVLRPNGVFIFSSHNPRAILAKPNWRQRRIQAFVRKRMGRWAQRSKSVLAAANAAKAVQGIFRALTRSIALLSQRTHKSAFWRGQGDMFDPVHGGLTTHYATPQRVAEELRQNGFQVVNCIGENYPARSHVLMTNWYYYVCIKTVSVAGESCV
jgi:ubiquinone/menaquinone biosynthesis C-methylase UbiE